MDWFVISIEFAPEAVRHQDYYGDDGLYQTFGEIKQLADDILQLNQQEMKKASEAASRSADSSLVWLSIDLIPRKRLHVFRSADDPNDNSANSRSEGGGPGNHGRKPDQVVPVFFRVMNWGSWPRHLTSWARRTAGSSRVSVCTFASRTADQPGDD